ncbi:hypothetical protein GCM10028791_33150 [Echinicola sediminis]
MGGSKDKLAVYISYAWNEKSEAIADALEQKLTDMGAHFMRDKTELNYKGRIRDFMDQIGRGEYVILILSNDYFQSEYCMYELLQIFKNQRFYDRIYPIVLEEVSISKATDRVELVKYWENKSKELDKKIRELENLSNIQGISEDLNLYQEIRNNIANLTRILKDINYLNTDMHIKADFSQIIQLIKQHHTEDFQDSEDKNPYQKWIIVVILMIVLGLVYWYLPITDKGTGKTDKFPITEDSIKVPDTASGLPVEKQESNNHKVTGNPDASKIEGNEKKRYEVTLVVPSRMVNAEVFVDGKEALVLDRNLIYITLEVREKELPHKIELRDASDTCALSRLIRNDIKELSICL